MKIEVHKRRRGRRSVSSALKPYCHLSGERDLMEVTEWSNGEGFDIIINRKNITERFSLTYGERDLLHVLMNYKGE